MNSTAPTNEIRAAKAFGKQSAVFDELYSQDTIIQYKRQRVREHVNKLINPCSHILELNAGTGEDAVYFAQQGHAVHATDLSSGMLDKLVIKISEKKLNDRISYEKCSYTMLEDLSGKGPYDHIFSNFAGLNCTDRLDKVLQSLPSLVKPGGVVTLVVLPPFCLWEFLLVLKGQFRTAFRRFSGKQGARSHIEGEYFTCWYYHPSYVIKHMQNDFDLLALEGLCTIVPPSYMTQFAEKYPRLFRSLCKLEQRWGGSRIWRSIGDYYMISFRRK
jgi:ubiquinone/menaquinone biosynthesis C-methylase UbiE